MKKASPKTRMLNNKELREAAEAERRAAIAKHTEDLKQRVRESIPTMVFCVVAYLVFTILIIHDAKTHRNTSRADMDWYAFIWVSAGLFGFLMVRKVMKWEGRIKS